MAEAKSLQRSATNQLRAWARVPTRLGTFHVATHGGAVVQTGLPATDTRRFLGELATRLPHVEFREDPRDPVLVQAAAELQEYAEGRRRAFGVPVRLEGTAFQKKVWQALAAIPYGETRSYHEVAHAIGRPGASRAVGQANHHNPVAPLIPCHRVVTSSGTLGGYGGGVDLKRAMLQQEGVQLR
ncbi:MAG TPA: methylated-DNA--[protein]-cysteine S-methyltransferase [Candidatus Thermoplasmatota archaeon]|nr:methylated-DNA--[protein]-cysteine S-methyltransferase [Candidatus Thermoplasmatota archaeon]